MFPLFKAGTQAAGLTKVSGWEKINLCPAFAGHPAECGPVAQLGARFHGMEEVVGSIPTRSTKSPNNLDAANSCSDGICSPPFCRSPQEIPSRCVTGDPQRRESQSEGGTEGQ